MRFSLRTAAVVAAAITCGFLASLAYAETWSDKSGKFQIEAEFAGVQGRNVLLKKPDGKTITVPIIRLSDASRERAKRLYKAQRAAGGAAAAPATRAAYTPPEMNLNFTPPTPPTVAPMPTFPASPSLQETVDFLREQLLAGHPEVFWYALPDDVRSSLDSDEMREKMRPLVEQQEQMIKPMRDVLPKLVEVLVTKKELVLGSQLAGQIPPNIQPLVQQGYDSAVGLVHELISMSLNSDAMATASMGQMIDYYGPRIGGHLKSLAAMAPPGMVEGIFAQIAVEQNSDSSGTLTIPSDQGPQTLQMSKYQGRWLPTEFVDQWEKDKEGMLNSLFSQQSGGVDLSDPQVMQQAQMQIGILVTMANGILDPLLAANTQQEFDQGLMQVMQMINMMSGQAGGAPPGF